MRVKYFWNKKYFCLYDWVQHRCSPYCHRGLPEISSNIIVTFTHWYWDTSQILAVEKYFKSPLLSTGWKPFRAHYIAKLRVIKAFQWDHFSVVSPQDRPVSVSVSVSGRGLLLTLPAEDRFIHYNITTKKWHKRIFRCWELRNLLLRILIKYHDEHDNKEHCALKMPVHSWSFKM